MKKNLLIFILVISFIFTACSNKNIETKSNDNSNVEEIKFTEEEEALIRANYIRKQNTLKGYQTIEEMNNIKDNN